uniref:Putative secreted protein n=1 Tax=Lutzomyia longipalpis TaxID=7200 RepID=A0A7G3APW0_LUTLO
MREKWRTFVFERILGMIVVTASATAPVLAPSHPDVAEGHQRTHQYVVHSPDHALEEWFNFGKHNRIFMIGREREDGEFMEKNGWKEKIWTS